MAQKSGIDHLGITDESQSPKDLRKARNRTKRTSLKYQDAINSIKQNPRSIAQVANEFNLQPESFRQYLHKYEPELISIVGMGQNEQENVRCAEVKRNTRKQ